MDKEHVFTFMIYCRCNQNSGNLTCSIPRANTANMFRSLYIWSEHIKGQQMGIKQWYSWYLAYVFNMSCLWRWSRHCAYFFCNDPKSDWKIQNAFCWGNQHDANSWAGLHKYVIPPVSCSCGLRFGKATRCHPNSSEIKYRRIHTISSRGQIKGLWYCYSE